MNQYNVREQQINAIVQQRQMLSQKQQQWNYKQLTKAMMMTNRFKYQNVEMTHKVEFFDEMRNIIYDQRNSMQDKKLFESWGLSPFEQKPLTINDNVPANIKITKKSLNPQQYNRSFGIIQLQGSILAKNNQIHFTQYHFNLRTNTLLFYPSSQPQASQRPLFYHQLNQRSYDYMSFSTEYFLVRSQGKQTKIKRDQKSRELIDRLERKLLGFAVVGAYGLRDEVPPWQIDDYLNEEIDMIGPINFEKENHLKTIMKTKQYKETMGAFFSLLNRYSQTRSTKRGTIFLPRWLKNEFRQLPSFQTTLLSNIVPKHLALQSLSLKLQPHQHQSLVSSLKHIFPFHKTFLKRSLILYDSQLGDDTLKHLLTQISYPMYQLAFPSNNLGLRSLEACIQAASSLYQEVVDFSYNTKLQAIGSGKLFHLINTNPSVKRLVLKGAYVQEGEEEEFFQALTNNLGLGELQIDFLDHYGPACIKYVNNYTAYIY